MKKIVAIVLTLIVIGTMVGCEEKEEAIVSIEPENHSIVAFIMADGGEMKFELYPEYAPIAVENFIALSGSGFYDGLTFHRIVKGFMAQGGDPEGNGMGGSKETIKGEFLDNGVKTNMLSHSKGVISMARSYDMDSASSQFFIMAADNQGLDGKYAAFGKLIEGEAVLDKIMKTPVEANELMQNEMSKPTETVRIKEIRVLSKD